MLGGGDRVPARRVHHDDAVLGGGRQIDVVDPDAGAADRLELGRPLDDRGRDLRLAADHDPLVETGVGEEILRRNPDPDIDVQGRIGLEFLDSDLRNLVCDENFVLWHGRDW